MKNTLSRISFIVHENQKFQVSDGLLCTISGGQDSILNLIILYHLESLYFFTVNLVYCNHFWQPTNFYTLFELFKFGYLLNKPINNIVPKKKILSEEDAHFWRQKNFYQIGTYFNLNHIILGHSLNDKIETSFWNFIRGAGPNGLISLKQNNFITNKDFKKLLAQGPSRSTKEHTFHSQGLFHVQSTLHRYSTFEFFENKKQRTFLSRNITDEQKKYFIQLNYQTRRFPYYSEKKHTIFKETLGRNYLKKNTEVQHYIYLFDIITKRQIKVKRPLLSFSRLMIGKLINENKLPRLIDITNKSQKLIRNKFRLIILPLLNSCLEIKFQANINKYLNIVEVEQTYFSILEKSLMKIYLEKPCEIKYLFRLQLAIKRSILKILLEQYISNQVILNYITHLIKYQS